VLAKSLGTTNPINMLKAAETALARLRRPRTSPSPAASRSPTSSPHKVEEPVSA
jgi:ribosomal protein S5